MAQFMRCNFCAAEWLVSEEDPDATMADGLEHTQRRHPIVNPAEAFTLSDTPMAPRGLDTL